MRDLWAIQVNLKKFDVNSAHIIYLKLHSLEHMLIACLFMSFYQKHHHALESQFMHIPACSMHVSCISPH